MIKLVSTREKELADAGSLPIDTTLHEALCQKYDWFVTEVKNNGLRAGMKNVRNNVVLLGRYLFGTSQTRKANKNRSRKDRQSVKRPEVEAFKKSIENESVRPIRVLDLNYYMFCPPTSGGMLRILAPLMRMRPEDGVKVSMVFTTYSKNYSLECEEYLNKIPVVEFSKGVVSYKYKSPQGNIPDGIPKDVWLSISGELVEYLRDLLSQVDYDIIQVEHSQLAWVVPFLREFSPRSKIVLDAHNVEYRVYETWLPYARDSEREEIERKYAGMKEWETRIWPWFDYAFSVSTQEQRMLEEGGVPKAFFVPTGGGIDPGKYESRSDDSRPMDILYIGSMNWYANVHGLIWFIDKVLPIIESSRPETNVNIVGTGMPGDDLLASLAAHPNIKFWGFQKDDAYFFNHSKVFIVPLWIGAGARVKVVTAWASNIPVVSTEFGAEGSRTENGGNILMYDDPAGFAEAVLKVLGDPEYGRRIADNAYQTFLEHYTVSHCAELLDAAYKEMAGPR